MFGRLRVRSTALGVMFAAFSVTLADAADADGNYAVRGAGGTSCTQFTQAVEEEKPGVNRMVNWMEGYITGINRLRDNTFDVSPILDTGSVATIVLNVCRNNADISMEVALARVLNTFERARVREQSEIVETQANDRTVLIRRSTLRALQGELARLGHYGGAQDGIYGPRTRKALQAYQAAQGIAETGLPDPQTVVRLLVSQS